MNFIPLCNFTHYSLQHGFSKPKEMVSKCVKNGYQACGISDYKSISGTVMFFQECVKKDIKPIIGCSFDGFKLFALNKDGWFDLIKIISDNDLSPCENGNLAILKLEGVDSPKCPQDKVFVVDEFNDSYYTEKGDADIHRVCLASKIKKTIPEIKKKPELAGEYSKFFISNAFYIPDTEEAKDSPKAFLDIVNLCEDYTILEKPKLPEFPTENGQSEEEYLKELCRKGWKKHLSSQGKVSTPEMKAKYLEIFQTEFGVIKEADLFGYFLIVWDILKFINDSGWLSGPGRGSAAGCLVSYLIEITKIDPIPFDLSFARFYNAGRNTKDRVSLPDIDIDVPGGKREEIINYIRNKYGHGHVSQMITYMRLQGRSALKEVLRMNEACGFGEMNAMTKPIPDEAAISDQLEDMDEEDRGIIMWTLINDPEELRQWCYIDENGELKGDYAIYFDQAIRLEGTYKSMGKHAAGVVISKEPLNTVCPMINDKETGEKIAALEMNALEALGHVKFDVLAISLLDKLMKVEELLASH